MIVEKNMQRNVMIATGLFLAFGASAQTFEWGGRFGGIGEDVVRELYVDPSGNSFTTGYFTDTANFAIMGAGQNIVSNGFYDVFVQKTAPDGNLVWAKGFGSTSFEYGTGITADAVGNVYVTGVFDTETDFDPGTGTALLTPNGQQDIFLVKLDPSGDFLWAWNVGGGGYDESTSVGVDGNGDVYLSGYFNDTADFDPGTDTYEMIGGGMNDNFVAKFSAAGDFLWAKQYGNDQFEAALSMKVTADGDQYITGFYNGTVDFDPGTGTSELTGSAFNNTGFLLKLNSSGDFQFARSFAATNNVISYDLDLDDSGDIYLTGSFAGTIDLDPGTGTDYLTASQYNGYVLKLDASGDYVWGKIIESTEAVTPYSVDVNTLGHVMTSGYIETTTDFNPDPSETFELSLSSGNAMGAFLSILDNDGNFINAFEYGGCNFADYHGAYTDADNNIYISGAFETTVDIDPDTAVTDEVTAMDFRDNYLLKLEPVFTSVPEIFGAESALSLFPNPVVETAQLSANSELVGESYVVCDQSGRQVLSGKLTAEHMTLDVSGLSKGVYILRVNAQSFTLVKN